MDSKFFPIVLICMLLICCTETSTVEEALGFVAKPMPVEKVDVKTLAIGEAAPDFNLPGTDGKFYSLSDFSDAKVLVIVFTCNHCPTAQAYEQRLKDISSEYGGKGVQLVAISPNSPLGLLYEELGYSDLGDDFDEMIVRHEDQNFNFPYLYDGDTETASLKYGPAATPHCFVFDKERKLQYVGRIDAKEKPGTANAEDLRLAIDQLLAGEDVANPTTKTFGCSTKWGWKTEYKTKVDKEWSEKEVTLTDLDLAGVEALVKNEDSGKLRLINVWATWCGPCRLEYPEFVNIQRMFGARDFEFVSIAMDEADKKETALKFLEKSESALSNYIFSGDKYDLIEAIDPAWNGALPFTVLIEPDGKKVWSHQSEVNFLELKKAIVEHPMIGRVY